MIYKLAGVSHSMLLETHYNMHNPERRVRSRRLRLVVENSRLDANGHDLPGGGGGVSQASISP